ncbi:hypothetical protein JST56_07740 [Candidatus Dependentiae bacterium]|nr:hypothetical protein [Candidatus Dependentiae bacterium]
MNKDNDFKVGEIVFYKGHKAEIINYSGYTDNMKKRRILIKLMNTGKISRVVENRVLRDEILIEQVNNCAHCRKKEIKILELEKANKKLKCQNKIEETKKRKIVINV